MDIRLLRENNYDANFTKQRWEQAPALLYHL